MAPSSWLGSWTEMCWDRDCCTPSSELCREQVRRGTGLRKALTTGHCSGGQPTTMETRGGQKYDHSLHQPPLQCRAITAPYPSRAPAASSSNPLALQQPCAPQGCQLGQAGPTWGPDDKQSQTASCFLPASVCWGDGATSPRRPAWTAGERRGVTMKPRERSISRSDPEQGWQEKGRGTH